MAFRGDLTKKRLLILASAAPSSGAPIPSNAAKFTFHREYVSSPDTTNRGFFRRFLQRRTINQVSSVRLPEFMTFPSGEKLREKLRGMSNSLPPPPPATVIRAGLTVEDARRILRASIREKVMEKLRVVPEKTMSYSAYVRLCVDGCGNEAQGLEIAKSLDELGNVIVLGDTVLLHPEQVVKSMESLISESLITPDDPRRQELEAMKLEKGEIDKKAHGLVQRELYCGLGFLVAQTFGFMRLTFWELSWDVMEPICFFVTSLHFAMAYTFFLRTSTEPSFEGYFQRRFTAKQRKLMKEQNFDVEKYNQLCEAFNGRPGGFEYPVRSDHANRMVLSTQSE